MRFTRIGTALPEPYVWPILGASLIATLVPLIPSMKWGGRLFALAAAMGVVGHAPTATRLRHKCLRGNKLPVAFGDDFDGSVGHFDGGLVIDRVHRSRYAGGPSFDVGERGVQLRWVIQMGKQREINQA